MPSTSLGYFVLGVVTGQSTISGNFTICASGCDYVNLTAAIADLNTKQQIGPVTFRLNDATYAGDSFPITINGNGGSSSTNTVTIKPGTGVSPTITGSGVGALIILSGTTYVTIDGSNTVGGTTKDLTLSNTNTTGATVRLINGASNNVIKNAVLKGVGTTSTTAVVHFSTATAASGNNNNTLQNSTVTGGATATAYGVYLLGSSTLASNQNSIIGNTINDFSTAGVELDQYYTNSTINTNSIFEVTTQSSSALYGIYLNYPTLTAVVNANTICDLNTTNTAATLRGLYFGNGAAGDVVTFSNNVITLDANSTTQGATIYGIDNFANSSTNLNACYVRSASADRA